MLTKPRRIAVVIAGTLVGAGLERFAELGDATIFGFWAGFIVASFVPVRGGSCGLPR